MTQEMFNTPDDEAEQRLQNQARKLLLAAKYGAHFSDSDTSRLPATVESQWLDYIEEFEQKFADAKRITVQQFVGNPTVKPLSEIPPEGLEHEVDCLLEFLSLHGIVVDFLCDVPDAEVYRFITEELLKEETDDVRFDGMDHHFIYEEFHPNDEYDVKHCAEDFLSSLFWLESDLVSHHIADEDLLDAHGNPITKDEMLKAITAFRGSFQSLERPDLKILTCQVRDDGAIVTVQIEWTGVVDKKSPRVRSSGVSSLRLTRSPYGGWDVLQAIVPGWNR